MSLALASASSRARTTRRGDVRSRAPRAPRGTNAPRASRCALVRASLEGVDLVNHLGKKRVVVTGMGITSCLGNTLEDVTDSLYNAK